MADDADIDVELELARAAAAARQRMASAAQTTGPALPPTPAPPPQPDVGTAMARGAGQGVSLGFSDELAGLAAAATAAQAAGAGRVLETLGLRAPEETAEKVYQASGIREGAQPEGILDVAGEAYRRMRDEERRRNLEAREAHPGAYMAAELAGGMALPVPGAAPAKGATLLARMGRGALVGGAAGLLAGAGHSGDTEVEPQPQAADTLEDAAVGGVAGAAFGAALPPALRGLGLAAGPLARAMRRGAEALAVKSVTPRPGLVDRLYAMGFRTPDDIRTFGRRLLDAGLIPAGGTPEDALERALLRLEAEGGDIGEWLARADALTAAGQAPPASLSGLWGAARHGLEEFAAKSPVAATRAEEAAADIGSLLRVTNPATPTPDAMTYAQAWATKSALQKALRGMPQDKLTTEARAAATDALAQDVYRQLEGALGPDAEEAVRAAARNYATAAQARQLLEREATRAAARNPVGLLDTQLGQVAGTTGLPLAGPAVTALSAAFRSRLPAVAARGLDALSRPMSRFAASGGGAGGDFGRVTRTFADYYALANEERDEAQRAFLETAP